MLKLKGIFSKDKPECVGENLKLQKLCLHSSLIARSVLGNQNILPFTADFAQEMVLETQSFEGVALYTIFLLKQGASAAACVFCCMYSGIVWSLVGLLAADQSRSVNVLVPRRNCEQQTLRFSRILPRETQR